MIIQLHKYIKMRILIIFIALITFVSSVQAQVKQLTFEEAVNIGLSDNVDMMNSTITFIIYLLDTVEKKPLIFHNGSWLSLFMPAHHYTEYVRR